MLNFTKGKWVAENWDKDYWAVFGNTHTVADCFGNEDNARLIAAAPELYDIVKSLTECQAHSFSELKMRASDFIAQLEQESSNENDE